MFFASVLSFAPAGGRFVARANSLLMGSLVETFKFKKIMNRFTFKTLAEAIEVAGLADTLSGDKKFTVFAPTDAAFVEYFDTTKQTKEQFLADKEKLVNILKYHVIDGIADGKTLLTCGTLMTLQGSTVASVVDQKTERAYMNDESKVETTDVEADNGFFHIIDYPMRPKA